MHADEAKAGSARSLLNSDRTGPFRSYPAAMHAITIRSWQAAQFDAQVDAVLSALGFEDDPDDPEGGFLIALELGLSDGDVVLIDEATGEIVLRTPRAQIQRNIEAAAERGDRSISELVDSGEIRRAELRDEEEPR